jgi:hypothetical protein
MNLEAESKAPLKANHVALVRDANHLVVSAKRPGLHGSEDTQRFSCRTGHGTGQKK